MLKVSSLCTDAMMFDTLERDNRIFIFQGMIICSSDYNICTIGNQGEYHGFYSCFALCLYAFSDYSYSLLATAFPMCNSIGHGIMLDASYLECYKGKTGLETKLSHVRGMCRKNAFKTFAYPWFHFHHNTKHSIVPF